MVETTPILAAPQHQSLKGADKAIRATFVRRAYSVLAAQLLLTVVVAVPFELLSRTMLRINSIVLVSAVIVLVFGLCGVACCTEHLQRNPTSPIFLLVLSVILGIVVGCIDALGTWQGMSVAVAAAVLVFSGMAVYAWATATDLTGAGPYLAVVLMCAVGFGVMLCFLDALQVQIQWLAIALDASGVLVFACFTVFDLQKILDGRHHDRFAVDDHTFAAASLYVDIANLALGLVSLFGYR